MTKSKEEIIKEFMEKLNEYDISSGAIDDNNSMLVKLISEARGFVKDISKALDQAEQRGREEEQENIFKTLKQDKEVARELPHPIEAIKFVMEQRELNQDDLIPYFGVKSRVSEALSLKRPLSKMNIRRLMAGLDLSAEILIQSYKTKP